MNLDDFVKFIFENVDSVNTGNLLKLKSYMKIKDTDTGYDITEFFHKVIDEATKLSYTKKRYSNIVLASLRALQELKTNTSSYVFDMWLFDLIDIIKDG